MKKMFIGVVLLLSGCAIVPPPFDSTEYEMFANVYAVAETSKASCNDPAGVLSILHLLKMQTTKMVIYTKHKSRDIDARTIATELDALVAEMKTKYQTTTPSSKYCNLKFDNIADGAERAMVAIGKEKQQ